MKPRAAQHGTDLKRDKEAVSGRQATWYFADLGTVAYQTAWDLQKNLLEAKKADSAFPDIVLFLEHRPVFTLGRSGRPENLKVSETVVKKAGMQIVRTDRGGDITYHGPGQLVVYPVINLEKNRLRVIQYVEKLEEAMIQTVRAWNIDAGRSKLNRGVWVEGRKLGSIGIAVKRKIAMHGLALNVDLLLDPYDWINPCGLENVSMTSMARQTGKKIAMFRVKEELKRNMAEIFKIRARTMAATDYKEMLRGAETRLPARYQ